MMQNPNDSAFYDNLRENEWKYLADVGPSLRTRDRLLLKVLAGLKPVGSFLDVGCGSGTFIARVSKNFPLLRVVGCDLSEVAISQARQKVAAELFCVDLNDEVDIGEEFENVLCSDVLEHVPDLDRALDNLAKLVASGGHLLLSVPFLKKNWTSHDTFSGHLRRFEPGELDDKLIDRGFTIQESFGWGTAVYELYYAILRRQDPQAVMANPTSFWKRTISNVLYQVFKVDDLSTSSSRGRRLIMVATKAVAS